MYRLEAYHRPTSVADAVGLLAAPGRLALAGGTTVRHDGGASSTEVVDLQALGLDRIALDGDVRADRCNGHAAGPRRQRRGSRPDSCDSTSGASEHVANPRHRRRHDRSRLAGQSAAHRTAGPRHVGPLRRRPIRAAALGAGDRSRCRRVDRGGRSARVGEDRRRPNRAGRPATTRSLPPPHELPTTEFASPCVASHAHPNSSMSATWIASNRPATSAARRSTDVIWPRCCRPASSRNCRDDLIRPQRCRHQRGRTAA